jgi:hypothetical protein
MSRRGASQGTHVSPLMFLLVALGFLEILAKKNQVLKVLKTDASGRATEVVETDSSTKVREHNYRSRTKPCPKQDWASLKPHQRSQNGEDTLLIEKFNGLCNGTYIEMGALDGVKFSNSHVFNKAPVLNWQGLLVELSPSKALNLPVNRPNEIATANAAVCKERALLHYVEYKGPNKDQVNGIWEYAAPTFRDHWWKGQKLENLPTVDCLPMTDVFEKNIGDDPRVRDDQGHYFFDFFSLDVEGAEWAVLQSIDWEKTAFGVLFLEADEHFTRRNEVIVSFLKAKGYTYLKHEKPNNWFIHKDYHKIYGDLV